MYENCNKEGTHPHSATEREWERCNCSQKATFSTRRGNVLPRPAACGKCPRGLRTLPPLHFPSRSSTRESGRISLALTHARTTRSRSFASPLFPRRVAPRLIFRLCRFPSPDFLRPLLLSSRTRFNTALPNLEMLLPVVPIFEIELTWGKGKGRGNLELGM